MNRRDFLTRFGGAICMMVVLAACGTPATGSTSTIETVPSTPTTQPVVPTPVPTEPEGTETPATTPEASTATDWTNGTWQLIDYGSANAPTAIVPGSNVTLTLSPDGKIGGSASCNSFFGTYTADGQSFTVSGVGSTEMACAEELMSQESAYLAALQGATALEQAGDTLTITYADGRLQFSKVVEPAASPLEGTAWQLESFINGDSISSTVAGSNVTATFADGKVSGSTGCNQYNAGYTLTGDKVAISAVVSTKMACDPAIMGQEQQFTNALATATAVLVDGNQLRLEYPGGALVFRATTGS